MDGVVVGYDFLMMGMVGISVLIGIIFIECFDNVFCILWV